MAKRHIAAALVGLAVGALLVRRSPAASPTKETSAVGLAPPASTAANADPHPQRITQIATLLTALAAIAAVVFTGFQLQSTRAQTELTEQGQITDRYSKAVQQLGDDKLDVRLGGIYALERLAKDSQNDQSVIVEVLSAYVRDHVPPWTDPQCLGEFARVPHLGGPPRPPTYIEAALTVLERRDRSKDRSAHTDLSHICLPYNLTAFHFNGVDLTGANLATTWVDDLAGANLKQVWLGAPNFRGKIFTNANCAELAAQSAFLQHVVFAGSILIDADFAEADLYEADLTWADLTRARLLNAKLIGANLTGADLTRTDMRNADLTGANLSGANLTGANLTGTNLTGVNLSGANLTDVRRNQPEDNEQPPVYSDRSFASHYQREPGGSSLQPGRIPGVAEKGRGLLGVAIMRAPRKAS